MLTLRLCAIVASGTPRLISAARRPSAAVRPKIFFQHRGADLGANGEIDQDQQAVRFSHRCDVHRLENQPLIVAWPLELDGSERLRQRTVDHPARKRLSVRQRCIGSIVRKNPLRKLVAIRRPCAAIDQYRC